MTAVRVPEGWREVELAEVAKECRLRNTDGSLSSDALLGVFKNEGMVPMRDRVRGSDVSRCKLLPPGAFAYNPMRLNIGSIARWAGDEDAIVSPDYVVFQCDERQLSGEFLEYVRQSKDWAAYMENAGKGGVRIRIYFKELGQFRFLLPPLPEQRRIAEILSSVDEAIAATQAVIEQTRTVKQGVLKRLLTKGIGHTRFKQTEIGEIPEAWDTQALPTLLREPIRNGYSPVCPGEPTGKWILSLGALTHDGLDRRGVKPAPLGDPKLDSATLEVGDIIISRSNTPERVGLVGLYEGYPTPCHYPDLMMRLRFDNRRVRPEFAAAWLSFLQAQGYFAQAASGTSASMVKINRRILAEVAVPVPALAEQRAIVERIAHVVATDDQARRQASVLERMRSALLSDLLTGRKRVPLIDRAAAE